MTSFSSYLRVALLVSGVMFAPVSARAAETKAKPAATPKPKADTAAPKPDASILGGIKKVSPTQFEITRAALDKIMARQDLVKDVRAVPATENGKSVGVKLFSIAPGSLLHVLGLQNGDRLETVNGYDVSTPADALLAYSTVGKSDLIQLKLNRDGQTMAITYTVK